MRKKEPKINRETYRFLRKGKTPKHLQKVQRLVALSPEMHERIRRLAVSKRVPFSTALEIMLGTKEAMDMSNIDRTGWKERLRCAAPSKSVMALEGRIGRGKH